MENDLDRPHLCDMRGIEKAHRAFRMRHPCVASRAKDRAVKLNGPPGHCRTPPTPLKVLSGTRLNYLVPNHRNFGDLVLPMWNRVHNLDAIRFQSFLPVVMRNECSRFSYAHVNGLDGVSEPQNSSCTSHVSTESLVAWFHCRVKDCIRWKNLMNTFFRNVMFICDFDETTLLCVRSA